MICPGCQEGTRPKLLTCYACHAQKQARLGTVHTDPSPHWTQFALGAKKVACRKHDAVAELKTAWRDCPMSVFNAWHKKINTRLPPWRHLSPVHELPGQPRGVHTWNFDVLSGEVVEDLLSCGFREKCEDGAVHVFEEGSAICIAPASLSVRLRAKNYYRVPFDCLPEIQIRFDTVALSSEGEFRWPEGVTYDQQSQQAVKRFFASTLRQIASRVRLTPGVQAAIASL